LFENDSVWAILIGVLVTASVYLCLGPLLRRDWPSARRALGLFAGAGGILTTLYLLENPSLLGEYVHLIVLGLLGVVLGLIGLARWLAR